MAGGFDTLVSRRLRRNITPGNVDYINRDPLVIPQTMAKKYGPARGAAIALRQKRGRSAGFSKGMLP